MKAKIYIELFDDTPMSALDEVGLTTKFLKTCYEAGFETYLKKICADGLDYTLSVEIEDNTTK